MTFEGIFRRRRLPHWDVADATYFITTCLAGSVPAAGLKALHDYRLQLDGSACPADISASEWEIRKHKLIFRRLDELLDHQPAVHHLDNPKLAQIVRDALCFFAGEKYNLLAFVVMPSHFHWLMAPTAAYCEATAAKLDGRTPRERIMKSIKGYTARHCNMLLQRTGKFWQDESYDHCVRNDDELLRIIEYIEQNPVRAKLVSTPEEWLFSSARDRAKQFIKPGDPLTSRGTRQMGAEEM